MMRLPACLFLLLLATAPFAAGAADTAHGKALQQANCMACHDDGIYTREGRRVNSLDGLNKQVRRCDLSLGLKWFDEDVDDVVGYLNETFYKF